MLPDDDPNNSTKIFKICDAIQVSLYFSYDFYQVKAD